MVCRLLGQRSAAIAVVGTGINRRIAVEPFAPLPGKRHPDPISLARHWRELGHHQHRFAFLVSPQQPTYMLVKTGISYSIQGIDGDAS
ncbi:hypothetical protein D3C76_1659980 [compost metagenome]